MLLVKITLGLQVLSLYGFVFESITVDFLPSVIDWYESS